MPSHNRKYYRINEIDSRGGGTRYVDAAEDAKENMES